MDNQIEKFRNKLKESKKILLINHRFMDWDAFWSLSAFYYTLKKIWIYEIKVVNDFLTPEKYEFLKIEELFEPDLDIKEFNPDLIISFDVASIEQLGIIYKKYIEIFNKTTFVVIDHHISNNWFWDINIIDLNSSSTCEIVYGLIIKFWFLHLIDDLIATFLLAWIITDTNSFLNTNSSPKSLKIAWELMNYSTHHQDIIINLFKKKPYSRLKFWWTILESLKDLQDWKIVRNIIPQSIFIQTQTTSDDVLWLIDDFLITIETLEIGFLLYEIWDKKIKWSFRSKTDRVDLNLFCQNFWWGWHKRAAWFLIEWKNIYEVEQEVIEKLKSYI